MRRSAIKCRDGYVALCDIENLVSVWDLEAYGADGWDCLFEQYAPPATVADTVPASLRENRRRFPCLFLINSSTPLAGGAREVPRHRSLLPATRATCSGRCGLTLCAYARVEQPVPPPRALPRAYCFARALLRCVICHPTPADLQPNAQESNGARVRHSVGCCGCGVRRWR